MKMSSRRDLVEGYVGRGWWVLTVHLDSKQPQGKTGVNGATNDLVTARNRWKTTDWNIGIDCGRSGLLVVDLDVDKDDPTSWATSSGPTPGISWWLEACDQRDFEPFATYCVVTPRNGMHVYYHLSPDVNVRSRNGVIAPLVDIKSTGGYVLAAGSVVDGKPYEYAETQLDVAPAPSWLLALVTEPERDQEDMRNIAAVNAMLAEKLRDRPRDIIREKAQQLALTPEGSRNEALNKIAFQLFECSPPEAELVIEDELTSAALRAGLHANEIRDTLRSARRAPKV